jgi:hypothetical protein
MTAPQARNAIRKALVEIIDPKPKKREIDAMWHHFESRCAFCRIKLNRKDRKGHADHLVPASAGGHNHIYNRVLACATCNGDEKLDHDWHPFLKGVKTEEDIATRETRIEAWQAQHQAECSVEHADLAEALLAAEAAIEAFNKACDNVRAVRSRRRSPSH